MHEERIIHRDIKPDNFLIGGTDSTKDSIFIIDFGLAKCYKNSDREHIPYRDGKNLTGTARYASINTHKGVGKSYSITSNRAITKGRLGNYSARAFVSFKGKFALARSSREEQK